MDKANHNPHFGIKFLLTTFSLTLVLGFWNLIARREGTNGNPINQDNPVTEPWQETLSDGMTVPTLVPLVWAPIENDPDNAQTNQGLSGDIREVHAPTPQPVSQQQAPVVENITMGQPQPVSPQQPHPQPTSITTTGSSK